MMKALWALSILGLIALHLLFSTKTQTIYGITESQETQLNSESASELVKYFVSPGQSVFKGDTLALLRNTELELQIKELERQKNALQGKTILSQTDLEVQKNSLKHLWLQKQSSLEGEIQRLANQYKQKLALQSAFLKENSSKPDSSKGILFEIKSLKKQIAREKKNYLRQANLLTGSTGIQNKSGKEQLSQITEEISLLQEKAKRLALLAPEDGVISTLWGKPGTQIPPFSPILSLSANQPTQVRGFVHEQLSHDFQIGQAVNVHALDRKALTKGQVNGLGKRIVEFPLRLLKHPDLKLWGREVLVSLPKDNHYLLGEKVRLEVGK